MSHNAQIRDSSEERNRAVNGGDKLCQMAA